MKKYLSILLICLLSTLSFGATYYDSGNNASITVPEITITGLTSGYIPKAGTGGLLGNSYLYQSSYSLFWGDTANTKNTYGFTVNQLAADDEIISLKSSDVSQPMTAYTESDTYAYFAKTDANAGGLTIAGFTDATIANGAIQLIGLMGAASPTATHPAIKMNAYKTDGGTGITALGSTDTILSVQNQNTNLFTILGDSTNYHQWSGVAHGMTDLAPTDAYGKIAPINTSNGGLNIFGLSDTNSNPLQIYGVFGTDNPTDTTGAIVLGGSKKAGTTHQALAATETVIHLRNYSTDLLTILGSGEAQIAYGKITAGSGTGIAVNSPGHLNRQTYKVTTTYAAYADTDTKKGIVIATLPAKMKIVGFYSETTAAYTGGAVSATTLRVGVTAEDAAEIIADHDVKTAAVTKGLADADMGTSMTRAAQIQGGYLPSWTGTTAIYATINTTDANTNALTAGSTTFYIVTEQF